MKLPMFDTHHRQLWRQMLADHQDERLAALYYLDTIRDELSERYVAALDNVPGLVAETGKDAK
jgi:hypothetical protein